MEIIIAIAGVVLMVRVARMEDRSPLLWGILTFCLCAAALFVPYPFLRTLGAIGLAMGIMMALKLRAGP
jgi:hypothetical protein